MSVSGLSREHVKKAVNGTLQAAIVSLHHASESHYAHPDNPSESELRWQGIDRRRVASRGQFPVWTDCSSFLGWCYWNGLYLRGHHSDIINGERWLGGYTGTMLEHGRGVSEPIPGDAIIYGNGGTGEHAALYTGGGLVVSHGGDPGPLLLPWRYRPDVMSIRRYI
jgi:cell wall-associated NlpC family hydrolase